MMSQSETKTKSPNKLYVFIREFTGNTSFHGVRYTFEASSILGRSLWSIIVIAAFAWFTYQTIGRIRYFYSRPVSVNINVAFNNNLPFPTVAICNTNQYRMTKAVDAGLYQRISQFYKEEPRRRRHMTQLDDVDMYQTIRKMSHKKEDMIRICRWQGEKCSHENFTEIVTDFGVCFKFNGKSHKAEELYVQNTGANYGLGLYLNAETYESTPGPHASSGIQVLVYDGEGIPRVLDLGTAIPVYGSSRIGLQMAIVENLPDPYGDCGSMPLRDYLKYSHSACQAEAYTNKTAEVCGCIGFGQRWRGNIKPRHCNFSTAFGCYMDIVADPLETKCLQPCHTVDYITSLSFTDLSPTMANILHNELENDTGLLEKYKKAMLYREKLWPTKVENDIANLRDIVDTHAVYTSELQKVRKILLVIGTKVNLLLPNIKTFSTRAARVAANNIKNFEKVFEVGTLETLLIPQLLQLRLDLWGLRRISFPRLKKAWAKENRFVENMKESLPTFFRPAIKCIRSVAGLFWNWVIKQVNSPKPVLNGVRVPRRVINERKPLLLKTITKFQNDSELIIDHLKKFRRASRKLVKADNATFYTLHATMATDLEDIEKQREKLLDSANRLLQALKSVSDAISTETQQTQDEIQDVVKTLTAISKTIGLYRKSFKMTRIAEKEAEFKNVTSAIKKLIPIWRDVTKNNLISIFEPADRFVRYLMQFRSRTEDILLKYSEIYAFSGDIKQMSSFGDQVEKIFSYFPQLKTKKTAQIKTNFNQMASKFNELQQWPSVTLENDFNDFMTSITKVFTEAVKFNESLIIDKHMIRQNFLSLQIFYESLSYTEIIKTPAYNWFSLMCDVGGSAGLFLGGSILTILELLYYVGRLANFERNNKTTAIDVKTADESKNGRAGSDIFTLT